MNIRGFICSVIVFTMLFSLIACNNSGNTEQVTSAPDASGNTAGVPETQIPPTGVITDFPSGISVYSPVEELTGGDMFYAVIGLGAGSNLCGMRIDIIYDAAYVEPLTDEEGYLQYTLGDEDNAAAFTVVKYGDNTLRIVFIGKNDIIAQCELLRILFVVKDNAEPGEAKIRIEKVDEFYDSDYTPLNLPLTDGVFTVVAG